MSVESGSDSNSIPHAGVPDSSNRIQPKVSPAEEETKEPRKQKSSTRKKRKNENVLFEYSQMAQSRASKRITAPFTGKNCLIEADESLNCQVQSQLGY